MWIKDYEFYGLNITRIVVANKAVLDMDADEKDVKMKLIALMGKTKFRARMTELFFGCKKSITQTAYMLFKGDRFCYYPPTYARDADDPWPYPFAIAVLLSHYVTETLKIQAHPEWSELGDDDEVLNPMDEDYREKYDLTNEYFIAIDSSLPWQKHRHVEQELVDSVLRKAVMELACPGIRAEDLKCGLQEAWHDD